MDATNPPRTAGGRRAARHYSDRRLGIWDNGPAWDSIIVYLPYFVWLYRGETEIIRENAAAILRYLHYVTTRRDPDGLIHIGLGDWCPSARRGTPKAPLFFTDTVMCMDIAHKASVCFGAIGMTAQPDFRYGVPRIPRTPRAGILIVPRR